MGEIADDIIDQIIDSHWDGPEKALNRFASKKFMMKGGFQAGAGKHRWRTQNGKSLSMHDMTTGHLLNCLKICDKTGNTGKAAEIEEVLKERGRV